jgi:ABC-type transport system substrate-binding protein
LIDRPPIGLGQGQTHDATARRFEPLLRNYRVIQPNQNGAAEIIQLEPHDPARPKLEFFVVRDETTRALMFLNQEADVLYNTLSLAKTTWIQKQSPAPRVYSRSGLNLSYLGFSLAHPSLKNIRVRRALVQAIEIDDWIRYKLLGWVDRYSQNFGITHNPLAAESTLDELGLKRGPNGIRFKLRYFTTTAREGYETALWVRHQLQKIGVDVQVITLDSILYFQKMKQGESDLFSGRWFRFQEEEPISDLLMTRGSRNYFQFSNPKWDRRLTQNPTLSTTELHQIIENEMPFYPLYLWRHGLVLSDRVHVPNDTTLVSSLDESFRFLMHLQLK